MTRTTRRPQASKSARYEAPDLSQFAQTVKVIHDCPTGLLGFTMHSVASKRAEMEAASSQGPVNVIPCLRCDSYHVEGVLA